jgi:hypothetical protein
MSKITLQRKGWNMADGRMKEGKEYKMKGTERDEWWKERVKK